MSGIFTPDMTLDEQAVRLIVMHNGSTDYLTLITRKLAFSGPAFYK